MNNTAFRLLFLLFAILSLMDVFRNVQTQQQSQGKEVDTEDFQEFDEADPAYKYSEKAQSAGDEGPAAGEDAMEIRSPTGAGGAGGFKPPIDMPKIRFLFCVSCGYKQAFDQFSQLLLEKYPGVEIEGANYPPGTLKSLLAQVISFSKIGLIVAIVAGKDPFQMLGIATPGAYTWMLNNKVSSCLMLFMLSNSVEGMLMSTGAFEIYLGEEAIWSKVESGRVPSPMELLQAIDSHLGLKSGNDVAFGADYGKAT